MREILGKNVVTVQITEPSEVHTSKVMSNHWIVERGFAWLQKNSERHIIPIPFQNYIIRGWRTRRLAVPMQRSAHPKANGVA